MSERTLADRLFDAYLTYTRVEEDAMEAVAQAAGIDPRDVRSWPFEDFTHDHYDGSFEFKGTADDWTPTATMCEAWRDLGFLCCWICYKDGTEIQCSFVPGKKIYVGERKPRYGTDPRTSPEQQSEP